MKRCLMIGTGGMAGYWIRGVFPQFQDRSQIVGLVDVRPEPLTEAASFLDMPPSACFTTMAEAFEKVEADYCTIVVPPAFHEEAVMHASRRKMPVLSEKPISDDWGACCRIYRAVTDAGIPMQVVQNYRFDSGILTLKAVLESGELGSIRYLMARFAADYRKRSAWGKFRHEIPHSLLVEGGVHHLDQIRNLAGADCDRIGGWEWNPRNDSFDGESVALYTMRMANGVLAQYEGNGLAGGTQNDWHQEMYRAECEDGAAAIDRDGVVRITRHTPGRGLRIEDVPRIRRKHEGHAAMVEQFLDWLDGGPTPPTALSDNIRSAALLFAAVRSSATDQMVGVQEVLQEATGPPG
jgi:predicted dehydrogenase